MVSRKYQPRYQPARSVSGAEALGGCVGALGVIILVGAIVFGLDALGAQLLIWTLSGYGVASGFWHAFLAVVTLSFICGGSAGGGSKLSKR